MEYRAGFAAKVPHFRSFISTAAARKSHLLFDEFYPAIILVWGCLANSSFMAKERLTKGRFYFVETYFPGGRVEIGEILPAMSGEKRM